MSRLAPGILALAFLAALPATTPAGAFPNIVMILADDLGYGDVQILNPERGRIPTPRLDGLAREGMIFTDAHSGSSVCTPTRYGLLTGRYAWRTRLQRGVFNHFEEPLIDAGRVTLPGLLRQQGYHTACIGKWHLGMTVGEAEAKRPREPFSGPPVGTVTGNGPVTRGFDLYFGFNHARSMRSLFEQDRVTRIVEPADMLPELVSRSTAHIAERAESGKPFFLYLALNSPHTPIVPSPEWKGRSGLGDYADFVMQTDAAVGTVIDAIDGAGARDKTLVAFSSDNGCSPSAGFDHLAAQGHFPSAQFRGAKSDLWDGGHRVPFLVRWPGKVAPGSRSDRLVCLTDLMATCAEIAGVALPGDAGDSVSFLAALLGREGGPVRDSVVHHSINGRFSIRSGNWKLCLAPGSGGWSHPTDGEAEKRGMAALQLYDLAADIGETRNVADEQPAIVERLARLLDQTVSGGRSTPGAERSNDVAVEVRKAGTATRQGR